MCYYLKNDLKCEDCEHYDSEYKPELGEKCCVFEHDWYTENDRIAEGFYDE